MTHSLKIALKDVFNPFLKPVKDGDLRKFNGSEFHSLGAHTEKALVVFSLERLTSSTFFLGFVYKPSFTS